MKGVYVPPSRRRYPRLVPSASVTGDDGSTLTISGVVPTDDAWPWFTDPDHLVRWWPSEVDADVRPGGTYRFSWPSWTLRGTYTDVVAGSRLAFTWSWDHDDLPPRAVAVDIERDVTSTRVTIHHSYGSTDERDGYRDGWLHFLDRLAGAIG